VQRRRRRRTLRPTPAQLLSHVRFLQLFGTNASCQKSIPFLTYIYAHFILFQLPQELGRKY